MANLNLNTMDYHREAPRAFVPSPQQQAIFDFVEHGKGSAIVQAVAGAGKTTTLIHALERMRGQVFFGAYNKKIVTDIQGKLMERGVDLKRIRVSTLHSAGFSAWNYHTGKSAKVNEFKIADIIKSSLTFPAPYESFVTSLVSMAKQSLLPLQADTGDDEAWGEIIDHFSLEDRLGENESIPYGIALAREVLKASIALDREQIDMDDMLFSPLYHGARFYQVDWVLIDEAQDTNIARRLMAEKMLKPNGRLIAVGDSRQAIYGFTGADADSLEQIKERFGCIELPLTVTYRCPQSVVAEARIIVDHIEAHASAPIGHVRECTYADMLKSIPSPASAILCRYTAPIVELAMSYIRMHVPCKVEGREIGRSLITLAKKYKVKKITAALSRLNEHYARQENKAAGDERKKRKLEILRDKIDTLHALSHKLLLDGKTDVSDLTFLIDSLFADDIKGILTLSTVHKSKGREWPCVYILGRYQFMPSAYAKKEWELLQEDNLIYVAVTRSQDELVYVQAKPKKVEEDY